MAPSAIFTCGCGRAFFSNVALEQHRRDKAASTLSTAAHNPCTNIDVSRMPVLVPMESPKGPEVLSTKDRWLAKGAGDLVDTITEQSIKLPDSKPPISIGDQYELICSYNWVNKKEPAVYVPGGTPVFEAIALPFTIKPDAGRHFVDQNAKKVPNYPYEVVFQATELMNPTVRFDKVDVLINRNSLRKFFDFCKGRTQDSFRVNLHLVNDTLIIERCERRTTQFLLGSEDSGFGRNFEKAVTRMPRGLESSSGHHRVLRYDFGGLNCAVRFEVDASYGDPNALGGSEVNIPGAESHGEKAASLSTAFSAMGMDKTGSGSRGGSAATISRGAGTDQAMVAELKSRKGHRSTPKPDWLPQLWFGRTRCLIVGRHVNGTFDEVHVHDLGERLEAWEKIDINQMALQKMAVLISRLRDIVRANEAKSCVVIGEKAVKPPVLRVHASLSGKGPLPAAVVEKFWGKREH